MSGAALAVMLCRHLGVEGGPHAVTAAGASSG